MNQGGSRSRSGAWALGIVGLSALACGGHVQGGGSLGAGTTSNAGSFDGGGSASTPGGAAPVPGGGAAGTGIGDAGAGPGGNGVEEGGAGGAPDQPPLVGCDPIVFEDGNLEAAVRTEVGKSSGPLTSKDVAGLSLLKATSLTSLKGVECLRALTSLDIGGLPGGSVQDLSPLADLSKLQDVSVNRNPLVSLTPLGKLPKLKQLFAAHIPAELDVSGLAGAPQLDLLDLEADTVTDLSPLGSVQTLRTLKLRNGHLVHPAGITKVESLVSLDATAVFDDVAPLAALTNLEELRISQRSISNFMALGSLVNLKLLDITQAGVDTLVPVSAMKKLVNLQARGNQIQEVSSLGQLFELNIVALSDNQLHGVSGLAGNMGIGAGDSIYLEQNPLWCDSWAASELEELKSRGAEVSSDCP